MCDVRSNVINAMGIRPHALLLHIYQILQKNPTTLLHAMDIPTGESLSFNLQISNKLKMK